MRFPILEFYKDESMMNERTFLSHFKEKCKNFVLLEKYKIDTALIVFIKPSKIPEEIRKDLIEFYVYDSASNAKIIYIYKNKFLVAISPLGCPAAGALMEELGFMGIKNFFACGSCGVIDSTVNSSNLMLVERAIRDEGLSYKYQKPSLYTYTDKSLTKHIEDYLTKNDFNYIKTTTWTTDACYRETSLTIKKRLKQGAVCVEMECAGWCAIAKCRGLKFAQLLFCSDAAKQGGWSFKTTEEKKVLREKIVSLMLNCVLDYCK